MADKLFRLEIISPDKIFYQGDVVMAEYNTSEGEVGIYANHIPMTQILAPGILTITEPEGQKVAALMSGFVEIRGDKVTMLAEAVEWPEHIDAQRAEEAKIRAERRIAEGGNGEIDMMRAELALKRALLRLNLAENK